MAAKEKPLPARTGYLERLLGVGIHKPSRWGMKVGGGQTPLDRFDSQSS